MNRVVIGLALLPVVILLAFVAWKDRRNPEPIGQILKALLFGVLSIPCSLFFSFLISFFVNVPDVESMHTINDALVTAFWGAAIPEESAKLLMLWLFLRNNPYFDERVDGIVYASCIALGFAGVENLVYLFGNLDDFVSVGINRGIFAVPGHLCDGIVMGYYYSKCKYSNRYKFFIRPFIWVVPVILHGIYDFILMSMSVESNSKNAALFYGLFIIFFIWLLKFANKRINKLLDKDYHKH